MGESISFPNIVAQHRHNNYDEVTYVNKGELYVFIDDTIKVVKCKQGISMPRGKYHTFIGKMVPFQYLTISVTSEEGDWQEKIEDILRIASELEEVILSDDKKECCDIKKLIGYLHSSILEIRWEAIKQVKRILSLDNEFSNYINQEIEKALTSEEKEIRLWGINMATEFCNCDNILIQHSSLEKLLLQQDRMSQWVINLYHLSQEQFTMKNDYLLAQISNINVLILLRVYSVECQYNCNMYPCAEGLFGIRIYEGYTLTKYFKGTTLKGRLEEME